MKLIHANGTLPHWMGFALISVSVRTMLFPVVLYGAQTSSRFAKIVPDVQLLLSLFQNDMNKLRERKASAVERYILMRTNLKSLGGLYKLHKVNPLSVFLSPLLQLPIFMYISIDLRKIVNGLDPALAQQLVESPVMWVPDLTEADPWFGLPVLAGLAMYWNVEVAVGKKSLSGPATAKADAGILLKDIFQSFAVFMPCFTSQLPAGVQIYIVTSFLFTMGQSALLRTESFRSIVGLPSMLAPPAEMKYGKQLVELKELERKARTLRGDGELLGKGVLANNLEVSFPGRYIKSSLPAAAGVKPLSFIDAPKISISDQPGFFDGVTAPGGEAGSFQSVKSSVTKETPTVDHLPEFDDSVMEKANRGEIPTMTRVVDLNDAPARKVAIKRVQKKKRKR